MDMLSFWCALLKFRFFSFLFLLNKLIQSTVASRHNKSDTTSHLGIKLYSKCLKSYIAHISGHTVPLKVPTLISTDEGEM